MAEAGYPTPCSCCTMRQGALPISPALSTAATSAWTARRERARAAARTGAIGAALWLDR